MLHVPPARFNFDFGAILARANDRNALDLLPLPNMADIIDPLQGRAGREAYEALIAQYPRVAPPPPQHGRAPPPDYDQFIRAMQAGAGVPNPRNRLPAPPPLDPRLPVDGPQAGLNGRDRAVRPRPLNRHRPLIHRQIPDADADEVRAPNANLFNARREVANAGRADAAVPAPRARARVARAARRGHRREADTSEDEDQEDEEPVEAPGYARPRAERPARYPARNRPGEGDMAQLQGRMGQRVARANARARAEDIQVLPRRTRRLAGGADKPHALARIRQFVDRLASPEQDRGALIAVMNLNAAGRPGSPLA